MTHEILWVFSLSLAATIIVELGVAALLFQIRDVRRLLLAALAQVVTNPPVVYVSLLIVGFTRDPISYYSGVALLELGAIVAEGLLYRITCRFEHPVKLSLTANICSFTGGFLAQVILDLLR